MKTRLFLAVLCAWLACCASSGQRDARDYSFVFLRSNPSAPMRTKEEIDATQKGHMENIGRLASERSLLVAGPFGRPNPDPQLRGLFVMASKDAGAVERLLQTDPAVHSGALVPEVVPMSTSNDLLAALERHEAGDARRKADPASEPGSAMRTYVVVFAKDGQRARRAIDGLHAPQRVVLDGRFGGARKGEGWFVLDAKDELDANAWLAPVAEQLGEHQLVPWFGSAYLREPARG